MNTRRIQGVITKLNKQIEKMKNISNYKIEIGWFDAEMAKIARIQEYGAFITVTDKMRKFLATTYGIYLRADKTTIVIPPRPHMQKTIERYKEKWKKALVRAIGSSSSLDDALNKVGLLAVQDYKDSILTSKFDKLSGATLHIRAILGIGGSQPLYATGEMSRMIDYKVERIS